MLKIQMKSFAENLLGIYIHVFIILCLLTAYFIDFEVLLKFII